MKIRIDYTLYTDGDYSLRTPEQFGCTERDVAAEWESYDYVGEMLFEQEEIWHCKADAINFLTKLLCDGISVSYTHYWLLRDFYSMIDELVDFIRQHGRGSVTRTLSGNYDGTRITVSIGW